MSCIRHEIATESDHLLTLVRERERAPGPPITSVLFAPVHAVFHPPAALAQSPLAVHKFVRADADSPCRRT